ncbi:MAG: hypothetical protein VX289_08115, partial [Candidatus Poribacteria bacterium]|nr:hypothetical protein [Candidatus Poribacteria bacterium]
TIGVVRNDQFAIGIQALSPQTIGGQPQEYPPSSVVDTSIWDSQIRSTETAVQTDFGSVLQAYTRQQDGGILGSKIAIFGCPVGQALERVGEIELAEGLPHPMLDGEWTKTSLTAKSSYLITDFGEHNIDDALNYTHQAGFKYLYHSGPFHNWGHFDLQPQNFPEGDASLKRCVDQASESGIRMGVHTLSNFITTNDPYVSPIPEERLKKLGISQVLSDISVTETEIQVVDPTPFQEQQTLSTVVVEDELIQYRSISETKPWTLQGCKRGAFGTIPANHSAGTKIGKLIDHPYKVFFPNLELQDKLAERLVELFNSTGLRQISFDGLEGCERTGHGIYAHHRFVKQCFDGWNMEVVNDASRLLHYLWHIHTRMNWGEPWGASMREGQTEYRFKNQEYFERNLFPRMMGWFQLSLASGDLESTTLSDIEWMLSKCAGFDAGFALFSALDTLENNGQTPMILAAIKDWENARLAGAFTPKLRDKPRHSAGEFHLEKIDQNSWDLYQVDITDAFTYVQQQKQPGEPADEIWTFSNRFGMQPFQFILRVIPDPTASQNERVINPTFEVGFEQIIFSVDLEPNQYLVCDGHRPSRVYDLNWNFLYDAEPSVDIPQILDGQQEIKFYCHPDTKHQVSVKFKAISNPKRLSVP